MNIVLDGQRAVFLQSLDERAENAQYHLLYKHLDWNVNDIGSKSSYDSTIIARCRGELLNVNWQPWLRSRSSYLCSLCNLAVNESVEHFVAECPILG